MKPVIADGEAGEALDDAPGEPLLNTGNGEGDNNGDEETV